MLPSLLLPGVVGSILEREVEVGLGTTAGICEGYSEARPGHGG